MSAGTSCLNPYAVTHDVQEFLHEADTKATEAALHEANISCRKNPGHVAFIPINKFSLDSLGHLPACRRQDVLDLVTQQGELTVRIRVSYISPSRPRTFPDTGMEEFYPYYTPGGTYPYKNWAGTYRGRVGSGYVAWMRRGGDWRHGGDEHDGDNNPGEDEDDSDSDSNDDPGNILNQNEGSSLKSVDTNDTPLEENGSRDGADHPKDLCPCSQNCPEWKWAELDITTALHLVYDQQEADHMELEFFFDDDFDRTEGKTTKISGAEVDWTHLDGDSCHLTCYTHDQALIRRLERARARWSKAQKKLDRVFSEEDGRLVVMVSHPHGCAKAVTVGNITEQSGMGLLTTSTYTAPSCPGSSGAPVLCWEQHTDWSDYLVLQAPPSPHSGSLTCNGIKLGRCGI